MAERFREDGAGEETERERCFEQSSAPCGDQGDRKPGRGDTACGRVHAGELEKRRRRVG